MIAEYLVRLTTTFRSPLERVLLCRLADVMHLRLEPRVHGHSLSMLTRGHPDVAMHTAENGKILSSGCAHFCDNHSSHVGVRLLSYQRRSAGQPPNPGAVPQRMPRLRAVTGSQGTGQQHNARLAWISEPFRMLALIVRSARFRRNAPPRPRLCL